MSQIATALAKAKERPATQAPFMVTAAANRFTPPVPRHFSVNLIWGILLVMIVASAGALIWWTQRVDAPAHVASSVGSIPDATSSDQIVGAARDLTATPQISPAMMAARITRNESAVRELNISAVLPGDSPRIMANGRIYHVGDIVLPEISFAGTDAGQLVFTDRSGNRFTRRY